MEGFLLIDKLAGLTSHDVVDRVRRLSGERRVGHAGTLDPFATGLLIVGVGRTATREMQKIVGLDKEYQAVFVLGATSDTDDTEGVIEVIEGIEVIGEEHIRDAMETFVGTIEQIPPTYSAIKVKGKKMYEAARKGQPIKAEPRTVRVDKFALDSFAWPELHTTITCGSGTYIRALARDLGEVLGVGGYVRNLQRTQIGPFTLQAAATLEELEHHDASTRLIPVKTLLEQLPEA